MPKSKLIAVGISLLFAALCIGGTVICVQRSSTTVAPYQSGSGLVEQGEGDVVTGKVASRTPTITFSGTQHSTCSRTDPYVTLRNPDVNFVEMKFTVSDADTQDVIAESEAVAPGEAIRVNLWEYYKTPGDYKVIVYITTTDPSTGAPCSGMNEQMEVTIT